MRRAFIARPGCKLVVADYSMFELRIMAHYSKDEAMCRALRDGRDLHSITAIKCWNLKCKESEVKKLYPDERHGAKAINFGLQYGMRAGLLAGTLGCTKAEAQAYIDAYFDLYSGVYLWIQKTIQNCRKNGYVTTILGRRRNIPEINLDGDENWGRRMHAENQAMNAPIQGSVADIIKLAMNSIEEDEWLRDHEAKLLLQIHDELIVEAPALFADEVKDRVKDIMETSYKLRVPTIVSVGVSDNWEEAKN